jgi:linoleoyl-CoA desaturase
VSYFGADKTGFQEKLNFEISQYFKQNSISRYANAQMWIKTFVLIGLWILSLFFIYTNTTDFPTAVYYYLIHGFFSLLVVFNIGHDAAHGAYSPKKWVNDILAYSFNLLGGNKFSWHLKHNIGHHFYTNIHGKDIDIETTPLFRVSAFTKWKWYYRFQHFYILPLYCILSLALIFVLDFKVMFVVKTNRFNINMLKEWTILLISKAIYILYIIVLPSIFLPLTIGQTFLCFLLMHCLLGLFISLVLLPSHFVSHAVFFEIPNENRSQNSWTKHQLMTTIDIALENKLVHFMLGGLNTNVLHHIYPKICHVHFVPLVKILRKIAGEFNQPYQSYSLGSAMKEHFLFLKKMGRKPI